MALAIMQPYFLPYIGYWQLINAVDTFIIYDNIQFSKKGWFHRNNILINGKKTLFTIPIKKDSDSLNVIERFIADDSKKVINKILRQIEVNYSKAPYFTEIMPMIKGIFQYEEKNLFKFIYNSIIKICSYLEIDTKIIISSTINIDHKLKSQDKVIALNKALNATRYINSIGGIELYSKEIFMKEKIDLKFIKSYEIKYKQFNNKFIPYLSIIDVLMFCNKSEIKNLLEEFVIE